MLVGACWSTLAGYMGMVWDQEGQVCETTTQHGRSRTTKWDEAEHSRTAMVHSTECAIFRRAISLSDPDEVSTRPNAKPTYSYKPRND